MAWGKGIGFCSQLMRYSSTAACTASVDSSPGHRGKGRGETLGVAVDRFITAGVVVFFLIVMSVAKVGPGVVTAQYCAGARSWIMMLECA